MDHARVGILPATHQRRLDELNVKAEDGATVSVQLQDPNGRHDAAA